MKAVEALREFREELEAAERKFPKFPRDAIHAAAIVAEESGELVQAALQYTYEGGSCLQLRKRIHMPTTPAAQNCRPVPCAVIRRSKISGIISWIIIVRAAGGNFGRVPETVACNGGRDQRL